MLFICVYENKQKKRKQSCRNVLSPSKKLAMNENDVFKIRVEYGHFETYVYWGCEITPLPVDDEQNSNGAQQQFQLRLQTLDNDAAACVTIGKADLNRLWARADESNVWNLPSSNYDFDLSDDLYHFGASVELQHGKKFFVHKIPTGVAVRYEIFDYVFGCFTLSESFVVL
jgi:hypothetical protein